MPQTTATNCGAVFRASGLFEKNYLTRSRILRIRNQASGAKLVRDLERHACDYCAESQVFVGNENIVACASDIEQKAAHDVPPIEGRRTVVGAAPGIPGRG